MTYKINGVELIDQPTNGGWVGRDEIGTDGMGHPIYPGVREYELSWDVVSATGMNQLQTFYNASTTGTVVVELPRYAYYGYQFYAYTGCILSEPLFGKYFAEHYLDVSIIIRNIRT